MIDQEAPRHQQPQHRRHGHQPHSPLNRIKASSPNPSVGGMKRLLARLELISRRPACWESTWAGSTANYPRILFHSMRTASADRVRRIAPPRRHLALVCFLHQAWRDTLESVSVDARAAKARAQEATGRSGRIRAMRTNTNRSLSEKIYVRLSLGFLGAAFTWFVLHVVLIQAGLPGMPTMPDSFTLWDSCVQQGGWLRLCYALPGAVSVAIWTVGACVCFVVGGIVEAVIVRFYPGTRR